MRRHDLVRPAPAAWTALLRARPDLGGVPHLADWAERGRPLILRRYGPGEARDRLPLGLPLPPSAGKRRIGLALAPDDVRPVDGPTLRDARDVAPAAWRPGLDDLMALADRYGLSPRPFGSLLWQALTGLPYLSADSDLDLLWPLAGGVPPGLLAGIARIAGRAPMRIDGELILPDGAGLHWRELHAAPPDGTVLAKSLARLEMRAVATLRPEIAA